MSDFLSDLVARTVAEPTLRPRTRSRFEAPAIEEPPLVWPELPDVSEPRLDLEPERRSRSALPMPSPEPSRLPVPSQHLQPATRSAAPESPPATEHSLAPLPSADAFEKSREDAPAPTFRATERVIHVPVSRPHRFDVQPPRVVERYTHREVEGHSRDRIVRRSVMAHPQHAADRSQPLVSSAKPEPAIQVSIGRIEVRAVPSTPPARSVARSATMTIDDYVAKRKARERR